MFIMLPDKTFSIVAHEYANLFALIFSGSPDFEMEIIMSRIPSSFLSEQYEWI